MRIIYKVSAILLAISAFSIAVAPLSSAASPKPAAPVIAYIVQPVDGGSGEGSLPKDSASDIIKGITQSITQASNGQLGTLLSLLIPEIRAIGIARSLGLFFKIL